MAPEWIPEWFILSLVAVVGLIFGSFVTLASYRLPRDEPIVMGRSRCPSCKNTLGLLALFPLFSWLIQCGKCGYCKAPVSARYPITEAVQALLFIAVYVSQGLTWQAGVLALLSVALLIMVVVDFEWYIIPDEIQITCVILAVLYHWVAATPIDNVLAGAAMGLALGFGLRFGYGWLRKKEGLGWGDVKFLFVAGLWLASIEDWPAFLFYAGMLGVITAVIWRAMGKGERFPFGPALAGALLLTLLTPSTPLFFWTIGRIYA
ncbi:MAG: prepilin peptidase [Alphaproteobacteria bacterium]|nr:prepilin peptidase [Alphaproteobacteria bacterium]